MKLDEDLLKHVADAARLDLTRQEIKEFLPQLKEILDVFSDIDGLDTEGLQPSLHPTKIEPHLREDEPGACLDHDEALGLSHTKQGFFKGPRVI